MTRNRIFVLALVALALVFTAAPARAFTFGWQTDVRVDDDTSDNDKKAAPRITFAVDSGVSTNYPFIAAWRDNRNTDIDPDVYYSKTSVNGSAWDPNQLLSDGGGCGIQCPYEHYPDIVYRSYDGSYWVAWQEETKSDDGDIYFNYSPDGGATWTGKDFVNTDIGIQSTPRIASDNNGNWLYCVWTDNRNDEGDIYISRYQPGTSSAWSTPVKVNDCANGTYERDPAIAVDAFGNVLVMWADNRDDDDNAARVYYSRWMAANPWGSFEANQQLSDPDIEFSVGHDVSVGSDGTTLWAAWGERVYTGPASYDFQIRAAYSQDCAASWVESTVIRVSGTSPLQELQTPNIRQDGKGVVHVIWLREPFLTGWPTLYYSYTTDNGSNWIYQEKINGDARIDSSTPPCLAADPLGNVVAIWPDYRDWSSPQIYSTHKTARWRFSGKSYLAWNTDLSAAGYTAADAVTHYGQYGFASGRTTWFNAATYLTANPDLSPAGISVSNAYNHYQNYGKAEGRLVYFDPQAYLDANPDLAAAGVTTATALSHYNSYGKAEGRLLWFDPADYLDANPDVAAAGVTQSGALSHYINYGRAENRMLAFDGQAYLDMNTDLVAAGYTSADAVVHFLNYGRTEGRAYYGIATPAP